MEPFYQFDKDRISQLRVGGGLGYVVNDRLHIEFIYHSQFTRPIGSSGLEYTDNIFRLNFKLALGQGLLQRMFSGGDADD